VLFCHHSSAFLAEEVIGEISWLGLESMQIAAELTIFPGLSLQEEHIFLPFFLRLGETGLDPKFS
jgi:hypothetical protein